MMKVCVKTLGCKVNAYESEYIISLFLHNGYNIVDADAQIYVINTCSVTNESDKKSKKLIHSIRKNNPKSVIIVCGCFVQNLYNINKLEKILPYADILIGNDGKSKILMLLKEYFKEKRQIISISDISNVAFENMEIDTSYNHTRAFIKIEDGCNNFCNYCVIPYVRGHERSKNKIDVLNEVKSLVKNGVIEVVLTGIHIGKYGSENYNLFNLLLDLLEIKGLKRIRISSIEVIEINDMIISILSHPMIANHMHIPLQSGCDKILKSMNRKYNTSYYLNKISHIRKVNPNISISTDVIVGYPGETEKDFLETYEFCKKIGFSKIHVFPYSDRDGTVSSLAINKIDALTKKKRVKEMNELSNELKDRYEKKFDNKKLDVLIESKEGEYYYGYTSNYILCKAKGNYRKGNMYKLNVVRIQEK